MKALTLSPDWAMLMYQGEKTIEFRTWKTNYRGDIVICSSAKKMRGCISGHAMMIANLSDIVPFRKSHLEDAAMDSMPQQKGFAWILKDFRMIKPVPVKGQLGLFNLEIEQEIIPADISDNEADEIFETLIYPLIFRPAQELHNSR